MVKVSIIIPVYNAAQFLSYCLDSVITQTLDSYECILVNDASTDNSLEIMQQYRDKYPGIIRIIDSQVNNGAGGARNLAMDEAVGEYIGFVDSDDQITPTMYELLYSEAVSGNYDVVDGGYYNQSADQAVLYVTDEMCGTLNSEKRQQLIVSGGYIWTKLFKKSVIDNPVNRFRRKAVLEDSDFLTYIYATINTISNVKEIVYYYRDNSSSSSNEAKLMSYYNNIYNAISSIYEKLHVLDTYSEIGDAVEYELLQMYSYGVNRCLKSYLNGEEADYIELLTRLAALRAATVSPGYDNEYVNSKMSDVDIQIMKLNDISPKELLAQIY